MNIQKMMKQVQQMQGQMQKAQAEKAAPTFEARDAGGKITATANGHGEIQGIRIAKEVVDPEDAEMLQELVLTAVREAQKKAREHQAAEMGKMTGGMGLPPGLGF